MLILMHFPGKREHVILTSILRMNFFFFWYLRLSCMCFYEKQSKAIKKKISPLKDLYVKLQQHSLSVES